MFAKQTWSASLVVVLVCRSVIAFADPEAEAEPAAGEARAPTGTFQIGAGYSSIEGFIARARISQSNLFGTGHSLSVDAFLSQRFHRFAVDYRTADLGGGLQLGVELWNERRQLPGFAREGSGGALTLSKRISPHLRIWAGMRAERVAVDEKSRLLARATEGGMPAATGGTISSLRAGFEYSTLDAPVVPLRGTAIGAEYELADPRLGSDFAFDRVRVWASHHRPIGPLTLHLSGSLTQLSGRGGQGVPRSEMLFLDDNQDIRGFTPFMLGSLDGFGTPVGGTTKVLARAELEAPLVRRIGLSAVGFFDAGGIVDAGGTSLGRSVGAGLLWRSPIGPLRFDYAVPLDGAGPPRFLFSIGGAF